MTRRPHRPSAAAGAAPWGLALAGATYAYWQRRRLAAGSDTRG